MKIGRLTDEEVKKMSMNEIFENLREMYNDKQLEREFLKKDENQNVLKKTVFLRSSENNRLKLVQY